MTSAKSLEVLAKRAVDWVVEKVWDNGGNVKGYVDKQQDMLKKIEENSVYSPPGEEVAATPNLASNLSLKASPKSVSLLLD